MNEMLFVYCLMPQQERQWKICKSIQWLFIHIFDTNFLKSFFNTYGIKFGGFANRELYTMWIMYFCTFDNSHVQHLFQAIIDVICWHNDIYSFKKVF
jgi:hypothetical protein